MNAPTLLIAHQAETGGGPAGFGLASFITLLIGLGVISFMLARFLRALDLGRRGTFEPRERSTDDGNSDPTDGYPEP
jgi:hypothetical protein